MPCSPVSPPCDARESTGVIIINLTRFGDLLQSQALVTDLHRAGLRVGLVCLENFASAVPLLRHVDAAWPLPGASLMAGIGGNWRDAALNLLAFVRRIHREMPGARVINLTATLPARLLARMLASRPDGIWGFGMDQEGFGFSGGIWTSFLAGTVLRRLNTPFNLVDTFRMVGAQALSPQELERMHSASAQEALDGTQGKAAASGLQPPSDEAVRFARALLDDAAARQGVSSRCKGFVAMQLGASEARRQWPAAHFAAVGDRIWRESGLCPVLLGSPAEAPLAAAYAQAAQGPHISAVGRTNIPQLAALLCRCRLLITNDTGTMHLAAGLGIPCLAIFLATAQPWDTGPYLPGCCCLEPAMDCHPCPYGRACPHEHACLERIGPQGVGALVLAWLDSGSWSTAVQNAPDITGEARVWLTEKDSQGFAALRCLSGHEGEDRSLWLNCQRVFWRQILDSLSENTAQSGESLGEDAGSVHARAMPDVPARPLAEQQATIPFSPAFAASVRDCLTQAIQLFGLLEEQGNLVGKSAMAGQLFLRNCERLQSLLDASVSFSALGGFWREVRQQRGGDMKDLIHVIRQIKYYITGLNRII
ncbi:MAG: glycosyl transferase [Desulfovibrio sp. MES5]|uniref:glycosyltransferase family 9 protein n=1 Tax=Desulfovibrio sp. MES5 TaxID=1899016 RepID=UPI000B9D3A28|nr:glycosyltransferase family 9 protein [Desulfovibrio sp. MES5]OXS28387.1 MAG: glycosyl transferase [Desulfovibrio sp. MES5]